MGSLRQAWQKRPILVVLILVLLILVGLLICVLVLQAFQGGPPAPPQETPVVETASPGAPGTPASPTPAAATATPTRVVGEAPATPPTTPSAATATPTREPAGAEATPTATARSTRAATEAPTAEAEGPQIANVLRNGSFEFGFEEDGVALNWNSFTNGGAVFLFGDEQWPLAILDGAHAQRITVVEAHQPSRHAGIFQTVAVVPGRTYQLTLNGQIRIREGSDQAGKFSYRMELGIDYSGGDDWEFLPEEAWLELPWDEQFIDSSNVKFLEYKTKVVPTTERLTIFIRTLNKWPDPGEVQYSLDKLSLVGPVAAEALIDQPLPATGSGGLDLTLPADPRLWASLILLLFLVGGAIWRMRYSRVR